MTDKVKKKYEGYVGKKDLFQSVDFKSHSGLDLTWKIECDVLTDSEWSSICKMILELSPPFREAVGIPRGGVNLANLLNEYASQDAGDPICIVDDVLTTGESMEQFLSEYQKKYRTKLGGFTAIGWVVFARTFPPSWIKALFQMPV